MTGSVERRAPLRGAVFAVFLAMILGLLTAATQVFRLLAHYRGRGGVYVQGLVPDRASMLVDLPLTAGYAVAVALLYYRRDRIAWWWCAGVLVAAIVSTVAVPFEWIIAAFVLGLLALPRVRRDLGAP